MENKCPCGCGLDREEAARMTMQAFGMTREAYDIWMRPHEKDQRND